MRKFLTLVLLPAGLAVASAAFAGTGTSTTQSTSSAQSTTAAPSQKITDEQLLNFDRAVAAVHKVRKAYAPKLQAAKTDSDKSQIRQQEKQEEVKAINHYNMTVAQFKQIAKQVRNDPELKTRAKNVWAKSRPPSSNTHTASSSAATK